MFICHSSLGSKLDSTKQTDMSIDYNKYLKVCLDASKDDNVFKSFKSNPNYMWVLEHVSYGQGLVYLEEIIKDQEVSLDNMRAFATNDNIGLPVTYPYNEINMKISPTTLRYVKVLSDLIKYFKSLDGLNIVEIGGGYGGQCKIIHDVFRPASYTMIDLPEVLLLTDKYLKKHNINAKMEDKNHDVHYDLLISNYAFTEFSREHQLSYLDVIHRSSGGYITCNFVDLGDKLSKKEILSLHDDGFEVAEKPLTAPGNFIYLWNHIRK